MEYMGEEYFKLKASIIKYERFVLKELGFCVHVKHPHKLIIVNLRLLGLEDNTRLVQKAWNYMNDSLRTNVFVRFAPGTIACACIFLSARQLRIALPQKPPWWTISDVCFEDIEAICMEILALYKRPRVFLLDLEKKLNAIKEEYSKKQIEIREVNLKKEPSDASPSITLSPASEGKSGATSKAKGSPESPALVVQSKLQPSPLVQSLSHKDSPLVNSISPNSSSAPIANGGKAKDRLSPPQASNSRPSPTTSPSSVPPPPKRRKLSSSPEAPRAERPKPIISPIRVSNPGPAHRDAYSEGSYSDASPGSSPLRENGVVPKQYRGDYSKHSRSQATTASSSSSSSKHHRHRHHHHHRSATTGSSSSSSRHEHQQHRHHHHRDRDREEGDRRRDKRRVALDRLHR